jgi:microsomal epoxide hydrolase
MPPAPFTVAIAEEKLATIRQQLELSVVGYAPDDDQDWCYGTDAHSLAGLRDYWLHRYDWRLTETALNRFPQFKARVGETELHFYHIRGPGRACFPLLLTHGWPGSVYEFLEVIEPLSAAGFDLVIPSIPGYGFSPRPPRPIGQRQVARLWRALMVDVLGYRRFGAQGGDFGAGITRALAQDHADVVAAIHLNFIFYLGSESDDPELAQWRAQVSAAMARDGAYMRLHQSRPQTIGLVLASNPLAYAAWVLEKFNAWTDSAPGGGNRFSEDQLLSQIMITLVNDAAISALWLYYGSGREAPAKGRIDLPTGFAAFPGEIIAPPPRRVAELDLNITRWTVMERGGHFAAWEEPTAFAREVAAFFNTFR